VTDTGGLAQEQVERRNLITSIFVVILIGIAYQETVSPVRTSIRQSGVTLGTLSLFIIFFLTSLRFFIGNMLHLMSTELCQMKGYVWFYDFMVIVLQSTLLIFLGGNASMEQNEIARIDFVQLLVLLYLLDVLWIVSQWFMGKIMSSWRRSFIPWAWCILNTALIASVTVINSWTHGTYSALGYILLLLTNVVAFIVDVILVDYSNML
jgi:hypothetical protein